MLSHLIERSKSLFSVKFNSRNEYLYCVKTTTFLFGSQIVIILQKINIGVLRALNPKAPIRHQCLLKALFFAL